MDEERIRKTSENVKYYVPDRTILCTPVSVKECDGWNPSAFLRPLLLHKNDDWNIGFG